MRERSCPEWGINAPDPAERFRTRSRERRNGTRPASRMQSVPDGGANSNDAAAITRVIVATCEWGNGLLFGSGTRHHLVMRVDRRAVDRLQRTFCTHGGASILVLAAPHEVQAYSGLVPPDSRGTGRWPPSWFRGNAGSGILRAARVPAVRRDRRVPSPAYSVVQPGASCRSGVAGKSSGDTG